ncbi:MAG: NrfD/PsrC family molybdoenzyme membrane anchor subunit [bacterium]
MNELVNTRHNLHIDPSLAIWGWEIPVYLFLGGLVAGMMIISGYFIFTGRTKNTKCSCFLIPMVALGAISLGMLSLFLDLEHKLYVWRLYLAFEWTSPMSWGSWILILVYPILIMNAFIRIPDEMGERFKFLKIISDKINSHKFMVKFIGALSMGTGGFLGMYTGVLLSSFAARPLWNTSMLWALFLVSGLSSAAAFVHLVGKDEDERKMLAKADNGFLILELMIMFLLFAGFLSSSQIQIDAAGLFLGGSYTAVFWVFVVGMGIVIPLIIQLAAVNNKIHHVPLAPVMVIIGGLLLRFVIVYAGQASGWSTAVFK